MPLCCICLFLVSPAYNFAEKRASKSLPVLLLHREPFSHKADFVFRDTAELSLEDFVETVLQFRGQSPATVKAGQLGNSRQHIRGSLADWTECLTHLNGDYLSFYWSINLKTFDEEYGRILKVPISWIIPVLRVHGSGWATGWQIELRNWLNLVLCHKEHKSNLPAAVVTTMFIMFCRAWYMAYGVFLLVGFTMYGTLTPAFLNRTPVPLMFKPGGNTWKLSLVWCGELASQRLLVQTQDVVDLRVFVSKDWPKTN